MKWNRAILALLAFVFAGLVAYAAAQHSQMKNSTGSMGKMKSVSGCLQKGDEPNEFSITGANGTTYGLMSSKVDLSKHVGHKVKVTGKMMPEKGENESAANAQQAGSGKEAADIQVTSLKMISDS